MRQKAAPGNTTATRPVIPETYPLLQRLAAPNKCCPEKATHLHDKGGLVLHPDVLPHHPAPVAEEVHGQSQNWMRRPFQEGKELSVMLEPSTCKHKEVNRITKG